MNPTTPATPMRRTLDLGGRRLSCLDFGGPGRPLLALHGLLDQGATWTHLACELAPHWRVIAPDQRGHGNSDRADDYTREGFVSDAAAVIELLGTGPVPVVGHSLGGLNALQLAAWHPEAVRALIIEDIPAALTPGGAAEHLGFLERARHRADTREELLAALGPARPYFADAARPSPAGGWELPFHPQDALLAEQFNEGDHWADWLASRCPALLIHGTRSQILTSGQAERMAARRPATRRTALDADHFVHAAVPDAFAREVSGFLACLD